MTDEEKIKLASQIAINFGIDFMDAKCRVEQAFMNFGKEFSMSTETSDKNVASEEDIKILENYLKNSAYKQSNSDFFKNGGWEIVDLKVPQAIEHILAEREQDKAKIKELEKENRIFALEGSKIKLSLYIKENYIPKQKIKDFKEQIKLSPIIVGGRSNKKTLEYGVRLGKIKACEELLKESEE